ncbi:MAG: hypothetical protein IPL91_04920 [Hyphomicrobium sp.]|nr:hypothetical protein [Hyphomicrobium sp.]
MAGKTSRDQVLPAAILVLAAAFCGSVPALGLAGANAAFEVAQGPDFGDGQHQAPQDDVPETEQPWQRDDAPYEDGTVEAPDSGMPEQPPGCTFRDEGPLELLV